MTALHIAAYYGEEGQLPKFGKISQSFAKFSVLRIWVRIVDCDFFEPWIRIVIFQNVGTGLCFQFSRVFENNQVRKRIKEFKIQ